MAHIAFVSTMGGYPWGGSEELWSQAAVALARRGHRVSASVQRWRTRREPIEWMRHEGVSIAERPGPLLYRAVHTSAQIVGVGEGRLAREAERILWIGWRREAWLDRVRPDLVCISNGDTMSGAQWLASCKERGIPYVTLAQANNEYWWPEDDVGAELCELMGAARRCFFVSQANLRLFEAQIGARLTNAEVVRNPCGVRRASTFASPPPWPDVTPDGTYRLACVGRLYPAAKGQDLVLNVLALPQWRQRNLTVSFFGCDRYAEGLKRLAEMLEVADRVEFRGYGQLEEIWTEHHALFLPSRFEGLPMVLVEAMACGRPVIVTAVAGNPEIVAEGETGFLAAAPTVPLVADALERAWCQRTRWKEMGRRAAARIREMVPADPAAVFADRLEQLCQSVNGRPPG